ncbi:type II secretion system F family protein [Telmatospirillum sp.]|uniref:type II secretion system F family protein n=1 Tax=Telmatospirillum sp. TaxID=2079197 RepID=UPI00284F167D|nr:type II secretion system F family protein [Telmatospirillum sp.]MDR3436842.1 type II secretion system F family protein [Telmatospirillum sp.]
MPSFRYVAVDQAGRTVKGTMEAVDSAAVIDWMQRQGHIPVRAEPAGGGSWLTDLLSVELGRRRGLSKAEVASFIRELGIMLGAGQDLDRALRFLVETASSPRLRAVADELRDKVRGGATLASALAQHPESFPELHIGLVRAGEAGGSLGETLDRLGQLLERERSLTASVQSALFYPAILVVAAGSSIALLLIYVLPQFVPFFTQSGAQLPLSTRVLLAFGDLLSKGAPWLLVVALLGAVAWRRAFADPGRRRQLHRRLLAVPLMGKLWRETLAARFTRTLGTLLKNGVSLIAALGIVEKTLGNLEAREVVRAATVKVRTGAGLAASLEEFRLFPVRTIHLLRLGEETAQLSQMALRAADIHDEAVRTTVQRIVALLVPAITVVMGLLVAGIVASLLTAMLSLNDLVM